MTHLTIRDLRRTEAMDREAALEDENRRLREALKPFATIGSGFDMEDVRRARAALAAEPAKKEIADAKDL